MVVTVRDVYAKQVVRITPETMLADAERVLLTECGDEAYVVDQAGRLLGVVPDYELLKLRMLNLQDVSAAVDVMTPGPPAVTLDTPLEEAACRLRVHVHRSLPVIDDGRLVGRVQRSAILSWYVNGDNVRTPDSSADHRIPGRPRFLDAVRHRSSM